MEFGRSLADAEDSNARAACAQGSVVASSAGRPKVFDVLGSSIFGLSIGVALNPSFDHH